MRVEHGSAPPPLILVVDDEASVRETLAEILKSTGYEVAVAASGLEALDMFRHRPCDALLTDLVMPELSGLELAERLRRQVPSLPVVVVSGAAQTADVERIRQNGFAFLSKPVQLKNLRATVARALAGSEAASA